ncbi:class I SAM-dependent methyltransferase [Leptolyngbya sp. FACHB-261]|uniref:class I SAM-dependent methyltransferase n=1 Tax=Leptolyngbya sp. FACHB-261 TaxID=2692806 RepID=UPI001686C5DB|nr:class I SAM-dependent methyltransferase [Leptolyngbya sp. FACHB-261]MBD2100290.1 class I SAM-dependent methyltransferase [Leptolyngbya sp. FACHB-261]
MGDDILREQLAYYRARASEYDDWFYRFGRYDYGHQLNELWSNEVAIVKRALRQINKVEQILELACGTGIWTQELLSLGEQITAIDASYEMIAINQRKLDSPKVAYQQLDLFSWEPEKQYDLVFFAFWLSHVPPTLLDSFLAKVYCSTRTGGQIFIVDSRFAETSSAKDHILKDDGSLYKIRKLNNGQEFKVIKVFYQPDDLRDKLTEAGFQADVRGTENYFVYAQGRRL